MTAKKAPAFTLIELLVAMAVMAVLVVLLLTLVDSASKLWRANESRVDAYREARVAINLISKDLQNSLAGPSLKHVRINDDAFSQLALPSTAIKNITNAGAIFFLSTLPSGAQDAGSRSDVCEVGYFLAYGQSAATSGVGAGMGSGGLKDTMNLYRYFRSSDATYLNTKEDKSFQGNIALTGSEVELLARNVRSFVVTPYSTNAAGIPMAYIPSLTAPLPEFVEIKVVAINQETAKKISSRDEWLSPGDGLKNLITQNQQVFVSRVKLNSKP